MSDGRIGVVIFRLAKRKKRFESMKVDADGKNLNVEVRFPEEDGGRLWLKGVWGVPGGSLQITEAVEPLVSLQIPPEVNSIELLLVDVRGEIHDYFTDSQR